MTCLRAPFPWFGGKSRAASLIWRGFGDVANYVEPFAGSLAVLLSRPHAPRIETVNDRDAYLANFWRSITNAPDEVAQWCNHPVNEADLHARHRWLLEQRDFRERMLTDPDFFDAKIAGWWVWGLCAWIGHGWCVSHEKNEGGRISTQVPHLSRSGMGVHSRSRQMPFVGNGGMGVHSGGWCGDFRFLADRLRRTRVCCGDWSRVVTDTVTWRHGMTGVLLDPPYLEGNMDYAAGGTGTGLSADVRAWAIEAGRRTDMRVALCGLEGEHEMPASWRCVAWKARGGYGSQRTDGENDNRHRERIWFSPACLDPTVQQSLFG
jgi:site-specific DNA-adenine methylase